MSLQNLLNQKEKRDLLFVADDIQRQGVVGTEIDIVASDDCYMN
jgi:hypothetical protein